MPQSRGEAARITEEATAYKEAIVSKAEGEAERFEALLTEYNKAPDITRERLYLEATQAVYSNTTKIMMDVEGGNNIMYLPLDQIIQNSRAPSGSVNFGTPSTSSTTANTNPRRPIRGREVR